MDSVEGVARMLQHGTGSVGHVGRPVLLNDDVLKRRLGNRQSLLGHDQAVPGLFEFPLQKGQIVDHMASLGVRAERSPDADVRGRSRGGAFNDLSHWGYGTSWGVVRGLLAATGMPARIATAMHGAAIWGSAQVILPTLEVAPPFVFWAPEEIAIDVFHHTVYTLATGLAYGLVDGEGR